MECELIILMGKKHKKSKLNKAIGKAWNFYSRNWRGQEPITPAFKEKVYVTRLGWEHLVNPRHRRSKVEKIRRLEVLPLAKKLLTVATTYQEHTVTNGFHYYAIQAVMDGKRIKVIVTSKTLNSKKCFLSVIVLR